MLMDILLQVDYKQWQDTPKHCRAFIISGHTFDIITKDDFTIITVFWVWLHQLHQPGVDSVHKVCLAGDRWVKLIFFKQNWITISLKLL